MAEETYSEWISKFTENFKYSNPAPVDRENNEQFPVIASGVQYGYDEHQIIPAEIFGDVHEAGFTVAMVHSISNSGAENTDSAGKNPIHVDLQNAGNNGLSLMFWTKTFIENGIDETLDAYKPYFGGIKLADEPKYIAITDPMPHEDTLKYKYRKLMEQNPTKPIYINLIGAPEDSFMSPVYDPDKDNKYLEYLTAFQENFKPSLFSYDMYPICEISNLLYEGITKTYFKKEGEYDINYDRFYKDLRLFSNFSKKYDRPFYAYCLSQSFLQLKPGRYFSVALEQYLRYEAFAALAYGAQGIVYWTFATGETNGSEARFSALTNRHGEKTASWYFAKKINEEIKKYKDVFLNSVVEEVGFFSSYKFSSTPSVSLLATAFFITVIPQTNEDERFQKEIVVSKIVGKEGTYFVVLNKDMLYYKKINIQVTQGGLTEITPVRSQMETSSSENKLGIGNHDRVLTPGGYRIFKLTGLLPDPTPGGTPIG